MLDRARLVVGRWITGTLALLVAFLVSAVASATDPITLPDTGVDPAGHVTAAITAMGAVAVVAVGGYFAFLIVRKALAWGRRAL